MQAGARRLALPGPPQADDLPGDDADHRRDQHAVDQPDGLHHFAGRADRSEAGQHEIGHQAGNQRQDDDDEAGLEQAAALAALRLVVVAVIMGDRGRARLPGPAAHGDEAPRRAPPQTPQDRTAVLTHPADALPGAILQLERCIARAGNRSGAAVPGRFHGCRDFPKPWPDRRQQCGIPPSRAKMRHSFR